MAHQSNGLWLVIFHINQQAPSIEIGGLSSNEYVVLLPIVSLAHRSAHTVCEPGIKSLVCRGVFSQHNSPANSGMLLYVKPVLRRLYARRQQTQSEMTETLYKFPGHGIY